jgi:TMEM175 potassium channel family protein
MNKSRLEAFSDGVIAIIITIMVLELHAPHGADWSALRPVIPSLLAYVLSFVFLGIYWNNHHHLLQATERINGVTLWANLHLLFWLSLIPFVTSWMGENHYQSVPTAVYGFVMLMCAVAFTILVRVILSAQHGLNSRLAAAMGHDRKGKLSLLIYVVAVPLAFLHPAITDVLLVVVALIWFIPDSRIEARLQGAPEHDHGAEVRSRG